MISYNLSPDTSISSDDEVVHLSESSKVLALGRFVNSQTVIIHNYHNNWLNVNSGLI